MILATDERPQASNALPLDRRAAAEPMQTERALVRVLTLNTHRGQGPDLRCLLHHADPADAQRYRLLHQTRAYTFHIAQWLRHNADRYHVVALQEVFRALLGGLDRLWTRRAAQHVVYRTLSGYPQTHVHRCGLAAFRYENLLLSRLPRVDVPGPIHAHLPGRVFRLAACGFTLVPFALDGRAVWVGNTHLHAYDPAKRARQAACIAQELRALGDVPVIFMGDFNAVPAASRAADPRGGRKTKIYRGCRTLEVFAQAGLRSVAHPDEVALFTHPVGAPDRTLDYVLFSHHFEVHDYRALHGFTLSDHHPVEATLRLREI